MATTNLGRVSIVPQGAYDETTEYKKLDLVTEGGSSYLYINPTPSTGVPLTNTSHWQQIAEKGDAGGTWTKGEDIPLQSGGTVGGKLTEIANDFSEAVGAVTVDSEVVLARGGKLTLGDRLDSVSDKIEIIDAKSNENVRSKLFDISAVASFISDDARIADYDTLKPIFLAQGVPLTMAVPTGGVYTVGGSKCSLEQLKELQSYGWEMISHSHTHPRMTELSDEALDNDLRTSKEWLKSNGFTDNMFAYPENKYGVREKKYVAKYFDAARTSDFSLDKPNNCVPISSFQLKSIFISNSSAIDTISGFAKNSFEFYKHQIDRAVADNTWIIISMHGWEIQDWGYEQLLTDIIAYTKTVMPIKTMSKAHAMLKNPVETGNYNGFTPNKGNDHFVVGPNGNVSSNYVNSIMLPNNSVDGNTHIDAFKDNMMSICVLSSGNPNMPMRPSGSGTYAGTLYTYKFFRGNVKEYDCYYQTYRVYASNNEYVRKCNSDGTWGVWEKCLTNANFKPAAIIESGHNTYNGVSLLTDFPLHQINYTKVETAYADDYLPVKSAGTLITYRVDSDYRYCYQQFKKRATNEMWIRTPSSNTTWDAWQKYTLA